MLGKISSRNNSSYVFASAGFVHPCQMRAIIGRSVGRARPPGAPFGIRLRTGARARERTKSERKRKRKRKRKRWSHAHYLISAIDIDDLAGNSCSPIAGKKNSCSA